MTLQPLVKKALILGSIHLTLAVLIGAFGAHGLKNMVEASRLVTFETGNRYHFYHGFGILLLALIKQTFGAIEIKFSLYPFLLGILFFSFNCYLYAVTDAKIFAMLVPIGGVLFVIGWLMLAVSSLKLR